VQVSLKSVGEGFCKCKVLLTVFSRTSRIPVIQCLQAIYETVKFRHALTALLSVDWINFFLKLTFNCVLNGDLYYSYHSSAQTTTKQVLSYVVTMDNEKQRSPIPEVRSLLCMYLFPSNLRDIVLHSF